MIFDDRKTTISESPYCNTEYYTQLNAGLLDEFAKAGRKSIKARHIRHLENHAVAAGLNDNQRRELVEKVLRPARLEAWTADEALERGRSFIRECVAANRGQAA